MIESQTHLPLNLQMPFNTSEDSVISAGKCGHWALQPLPWVDDFWILRYSGVALVINYSDSKTISYDHWNGNVSLFCQPGKIWSAGRVMTAEVARDRETPRWTMAPILISKIPRSMLHKGVLRYLRLFLLSTWWLSVVGDRPTPQEYCSRIDLWICWWDCGCSIGEILRQKTKCWWLW